MSTTSTTLPPSSSSYSSDLQQVLTRAIGIASLPLTQLNNTLTICRAGPRSWRP